MGRRLLLVLALVLGYVATADARFFPGGGGPPASPLFVSANSVTGTGITSGSGYLNLGKSFNVNLTMSETTTVAGGTPTLTANTGATCSYSTGTGTTTLVFGCTVGAGQNTSKFAITAVNLNGSTIRDGSANNANTNGALLPFPGTLQIITSAPVVASVGASPSTATLSTGQSAVLTVNFNNPVTVSGGTPILNLNSGGTASYTGGSGTTALSFLYTVGAGQSTAKLAPTASAFNLAGSTIADLATNAAVLTGANGYNMAGTLAINTTFACPGSGGTAYYVSAAGSGSGNGLSPSTTWVWSQAQGHTFHAGDCLQLNGGDTFTGNLVMNVTSPLPTNPFVVTSYGTGNGTLVSGGGSGTGEFNSAIQINGINGFLVTGINIRSGDTTSGNASAAGVWVQGGTGIISNNDIGGFIFPNSVTGGPTEEILVATSGTVSVVGNTLHGLSGINSRDDTGISVDGSSGTVTVSGNTIYNIGGRALGGVLAGAVGNGALLNNNIGGTTIFSHNLIHDIGGNTNGCGGPSVVLVDNADNVIVEFNEGYNAQPAYGGVPGTLPPNVGAGLCDWDGGDFDQSVTNSVMAFNYFHDIFGCALCGYMGVNGQSAWGHNTYAYNIIERAGWGGFQGPLGFTQAGTTGNTLYIIGNTVWSDRTTGTGGTNGIIAFGSGGGCFPSSSCAAVPGPGSVIADNIFYYVTGDIALNCYNQPIGLSNTTWRNNDWRDAAGNGNSPVSGPGCTASTTHSAFASYTGETGGITSNPNFTGSLPAGTCTWTPSALSGPQPCPGQYQLSGGSPAIGTGINPATPGAPTQTRTYSGRTLPTGVGTGYDIGAW